MKRHRKKSSSPLDQWLRDGIEKVFRNGVWRDNPWFLKDLSGITSFRTREHYSHAALVRAADALAQLYTPEACRTILSTPGKGPNITILFILANPERIFPFIRLGLDLADIGGQAQALFKRLRDGAQFEGALLEAELWAALVRGGAGVEYEPVIGAKNDPQPDFRVCWSFREYFVETKGVAISESDFVGNIIIEAFHHHAARLLADKRGLLLRFSERFAALPLTVEGRRKLMEAPEKVGHALADLVAKVGAGTLPAGEHDVLGLGVVAIGQEQDDDTSLYSIDTFAESPPDKESERIYRTTRDAARQLPSRGRGIIFVDVSSKTDLHDVQRLIEARATVSGPTFGNAHLVVVRSCRRPVVVRAIRLPGVAVTESDEALIQLLLSGRG
jgi:hypothetical protein